MVACQVVAGSEWILAKVVEHDALHGMFKLADEDVESNKSTCIFGYVSISLTCHL